MADRFIRDSRSTESARGLLEAAGLVQGHEQGVDFPAEIGISTADTIEVGGTALGRVDLCGLVEDRFHTAAIVSHDSNLQR